MQYHLKLVDMDKKMVMVVKGIPNAIVLMVVIPQIPKKVKSHCTTRSRVILRYHKEIGSGYEIDLPRTMRIITIDVT